MQPLLENAIYHGIKKKQQGNGKIVIHINESENELTIVIEDNGAGIEEQELQKLNQLLQAGRKEEEKSFGIYSINRRIHLFFGDEYGLILESKKDIFTRVVLKIPKWKWTRL